MAGLSPTCQLAGPWAEARLEARGPAGGPRRVDRPLQRLLCVAGVGTRKPEGTKGGGAQRMSRRHWYGTAPPVAAFDFLASSSGTNSGSPSTEGVWASS